ncbi:pantetheine-phosphate adenylyltransferase [bacterium]|nr:pantetheine-phosphate adenylyltransferase [bacterium]
MSKIAIFPGSFSPFTLGHKSLLDRALPLFDKIIISIGINSDKKEYFSFKKRGKWIEDIYKNNNKIEVRCYEGLTIEFCEKVGAEYIIRGLRNSQDFHYEKNIAQTNKDLNPYIETIFIMTTASLSNISSTIIRDIIKNGGDVSQYLPKEINL